MFLLLLRANEGQTTKKDCFFHKNAIFCTYGQEENEIREAQRWKFTKMK